MHKFDTVFEYVQIIDWALCKSDEVLYMDVCSNFIQFMVFVLALTNDNVKQGFLNREESRKCIAVWQGGAAVCAVSSP